MFSIATIGATIKEIIVAKSIKFLKLLEKEDTINQLPISKKTSQA